MLLAFLIGCARPPPPVASPPPSQAPAVTAPRPEAAPWSQRQRNCSEPGPIRQPEVAWRRSLGAPLTQPIFVGQAALWLQVGGELVRVERDGEVSLRRPIEASTGLVELPIGLLAGGSDGALRAFSPHTGEVELVWPGEGRARGQAVPLESGAAWLSSDGALRHTGLGPLGQLPTVGVDLSSDGRRVVVPTQGALVVAFGVEGTLWRARLPGRPVGPALLADGRAYLAWENGAKGGITALELETGAEAWRQDLAVAPSAPLARAGDRILVAQLDGGMLALERSNGAPVWSARLGPDEIRLAPLVSGENAWVADRGARLHRVDLQDGGVAWSLPLGAMPTSGPELAWGLLILGLADGELLALRESR